MKCFQCSLCGLIFVATRKHSLSEHIKVVLVSLIVLVLKTKSYMKKLNKLVQVGTEKVE